MGRAAQRATSVVVVQSGHSGLKGTDRTISHSRKTKGKEGRSSKVRSGTRRARSRPQAEAVMRKQKAPPPGLGGGQKADEAPRGLPVSASGSDPKSARPEPRVGRIERGLEVLVEENVVQDLVVEPGEEGRGTLLFGVRWTVPPRLPPRRAQEPPSRQRRTRTAGCWSGKQAARARPQLAACAGGRDGSPPVAHLYRAAQPLGGAGLSLSLGTEKTL